MNLSEKVRELSQLIIKGETVKGMELYYAEAVIMQENEDEPRKGKSDCIEHEKGMLKKTRSNSARLLNQAIDALNGIVFSEWEYNFISHTGTNLKLTEVSIQQWIHGLIVKEKFYYKEIQKMGRPSAGEDGEVILKKDLYI